MKLYKNLLDCFVTLFLVFSKFAMGQSLFEDTAAQCSGIWSASSTVVIDTNSQPKVISSAKGATQIRVDDGALWFKTSSGKQWPLDVFLNPPNTEIIWAGDSTKFAVNTSDGGIVGSWDFSVFSAGSKGPRKINLYASVHSLANNLPHCEEKELPNFAVVAWLHEDKELLVVTEVPPHSSCFNMGTLVGYRLSASSGRVLELLPKHRLLKEFGRLLGCRLR